MSKESLGFISGMFTGMARSEAAAMRGELMKVFDWDEAARIIRNRLDNLEDGEDPPRFSAGLAGDWDCTSGVIHEDGEIVDDTYTYLASMWATPVLDIDGEEISCWVYKTDSVEWDAGTNWPDSARAIVAETVNAVLS